MKTFRVYIEQINQTYFDVEARTASSAKIKAVREWQEYPPHVLSVEVAAKVRKGRAENEGHE